MNDGKNQETNADIVSERNMLIFILSVLKTYNNSNTRASSIRYGFIYAYANGRNCSCFIVLFHFISHKTYKNSKNTSTAHERLYRDQQGSICTHSCNTINQHNLIQWKIARQWSQAFNMLI